MIKPKTIAFFIDLLRLPLATKLPNHLKLTKLRYFIHQSKFYKPQIPVEQLLLQSQVDFNDSSTTFRVKYCPLCPKPHRDDPTNMYTLNVNK